MSLVHVFARGKAKPHREAELRKLLLRLVEASHNEEGVVSYQLFETKTGGEFLISEQYASAESFEAHKQSAHFQRAVAGLPDLLDGDLAIWEVEPVAGD